MRQCMDSENLHRRPKKIIGQVQAIDNFSPILYNRLHYRERWLKEI